MNVTCKQASALFLASLLSIGLIAVAQAQAQTLTTEATFPKRKPGLWQIRGTGLEQAGMPPTLFCVGEATDTDTRHLDRKAGVLGACSLGSFKPALGVCIA